MPQLALLLKPATQINELYAIKKLEKKLGLNNIFKLPLSISRPTLGPYVALNPLKSP